MRIGLPAEHAHVNLRRPNRYLIVALALSALPAGAIPATPNPVVPAPLYVREYPLAVKDAALSGQHSVILLENGTIRCTGYNASRQCEPPAGLLETVQVVAGEEFSAARSSVGLVTTWGKAPQWPAGRTARWLCATSDRLGAIMDDGTLWFSDAGTVPIGEAKLTKAEASQSGAWALAEDGRLFRVDIKEKNVVEVAQDIADMTASGAWNHQPIVGLTKAGRIWLPVAPRTTVPEFGIALMIGITNWGYTAATADGKLLAWWANSGQPAQTISPIKPADVKFIRGNDQGGLCAFKSGRVLAWGYDRAGCLRLGSPSRAKKLSTDGGNTFLAVREDGDAIAWGRDFLENGNLMPASFPILAAKVRNGRMFSGTNFVISDELWAFGIDDEGLMALPPGLKRVEDVETGINWALARTADGRLVKWGNRAEEFKMPKTTKKCVQAAAGHYSGVSLYEDGNVMEWGDLPLNRVDPGIKTMPRPNLPKNIKAVAAGPAHTLALTADGTVIAWGINASGQCDVPADLSGVVAIAGGYDHSAALLANGRLRIWGKHAAPAVETPDLVTIIAGHNVTAGITKTGTVCIVSGESGKRKSDALFGVFDRK